MMMLKSGKDGKTTMRKTIWFDMDGTLYDLYKIPGWLAMLENEQWHVFDQPGYARANIHRINDAIRALKASGWTVGVITWAPKDVVEGAHDIDMVAEHKYDWLANNVPELTEDDSPFMCVPYGENKARVLHLSGFRGDVNYLVDDNKEVRRAWRAWDSDSDFKTINASRAYYRELEGLVM